MKIKKTLTAVLISAYMVLSLASCGGGNPLEGTWKFDDGSKISFNTKKRTYEAKGESNSTKGEFIPIDRGTLTTVGTNDSPETYNIALTDSGFEMESHSDFITFTGKRVYRLEDLNGKYRGSLYGTEVEFNFKKSTATLNVTIKSDGQKETEKFSYKVHTEHALLFTSGGYACSTPFPMDYLDSKKISIDGEVLTR